MSIYYLSSDPTLYSSLLIDLLEKSSGQTIISLNCDELVNKGKVDDDILVILDIKKQTDKKYKNYIDTINRNKLKVREILFNITDENIKKHNEISECCRGVL